MSEVAEDNKN